MAQSNGSRRLREFARCNHMSVASLAWHIGVSKGTVGNWLTGAREPKRSSRAKIESGTDGFVRARHWDAEIATTVCPQCKTRLAPKEIGHSLCRACASKDLAKKLGAGLLNLQSDWY